MTQGEKPRERVRPRSGVCVRLCVSSVGFLNENQIMWFSLSLEFSWAVWFCCQAECLLWIQGGLVSCTRTFYWHLLFSNQLLWLIDPTAGPVSWGPSACSLFTCLSVAINPERTGAVGSAQVVQLFHSCALYVFTTGQKSTQHWTRTRPLLALVSCVSTLLRCVFAGDFGGLRRFLAFLSQQSNPLQPPRWGPYLPLICLWCTLFLFSSSSAVSLFPARATLAPLDLLQNDLSVKSDPFQTEQDRCSACQSLVVGGRTSSRCPPTQHGSKKRSPNISTVTLDSVDTGKEGCHSRGMHAFFTN